MTKSKTFNLFLLSAIIIALTLLIATFWNALGLGPNKIPLAFSIIISFGISILPPQSHSPEDSEEFASPWS